MSKLREVTKSDIDKITLVSDSDQILLDEPNQVLLHSSKLVCRGQPVAAYLEYTDNEEKDEWMVQVLVGRDFIRDKVESVWDDYDKLVDEFAANVKTILCEALASGVKFSVVEVKIEKPAPAPVNVNVAVDNVAANNSTQDGGGCMNFIGGVIGLFIILFLLGTCVGV